MLFVTYRRKSFAAKRRSYRRPSRRVFAALWEYASAAVARGPRIRRDATNGWAHRLPQTAPLRGMATGAEAAMEATMLSPRLHHFLDERHAPYTTLTHNRTITAQETANAAHIGNRNFAKTVMLKIDGDLAMLVLPAAYPADLTAP